MMHISVVVFDQCILMPSISSLELLEKSADLHASLTGTSNRVLRAELVAVGGARATSPHGPILPCSKTIRDVDHTDLVILPALDGDIESQLEHNKDVVPWVRRMYSAGADVASICTGAFVIAEAGLLDGKAATTHWVAQDLFRARYPKVRLQAEHIIVDAGRVCTSGGATSFLNLIMYLVEKFCGRATASVASKMFLIDVNKGSQNGYAMFSTQKSHGDSAILLAQNHIEDHIASRLAVVELADIAGTSRRNFIRRFKSATSNTPTEYIQRVRVEAAKKALESTTEPISEVVARVGYEDLASFRRLFSRVVGMTPAQYRRRYSLRAVPAHQS